MSPPRRTTSPPLLSVGLPMLANFPVFTPCMPVSLQLHAIHLRVSDLARSIDFYTGRIGFVLAERDDGQASLATSADTGPILTLTEQRYAPRPPRDAAGLFHAAMQFPSRAALGSWLHFSAAQGVDFEGFSDHGVSEAIYLSDPDSNGLEFYADRPRDVWPFVHGELAMHTRPLAVQSLLAAADPAGATPLAGAAWGHLHLRVRDLNKSETFYRRHLGLELTQRSLPGARFLSADGYHHHLGLNTWGNPSLPQPAGSVGLVDATFALAGLREELSLSDPDGLHLRLQPVLVAA